MQTIAILWDYDGTLMNSWLKNYNVNKEIYSYFKPDTNETNLPTVLSSLDTFKQMVAPISDWRLVYNDLLGLSEEQTLQAGSMWREYQLKNQTPSELFMGITEVISNFGTIKQGICSLNDSKNIQNALSNKNLGDYFASVVGTDKVDFEKQKPHPEAFFLCLDELQLELDKAVGKIFYIGDTENDIKFAQNAQHELQQQGKNIKVVSIAAGYGGASPETWQAKPDYIANSTADIVKFIAD